jgi:hypothetical protein
MYTRTKQKPMQQEAQAFFFLGGLASLLFFFDVILFPERKKSRPLFLLPAPVPAGAGLVWSGSLQKKGKATRRDARGSRHLLRFPASSAMVMAHATTKPTAAAAHDTLPPLPWPRPAPLVILIALLAASYLALTRIPAAAPLSALLIVGHQHHPPPHAPAPTGGGAGAISSCAGFYAGGGPARAVSASVEEFGAVGDGVTSNTAAFRRAVAELESRARDVGGGGGGSRLVVPPGRWLTGSFNLTSRFTLFLHRGAVILGSQVMPCSLVQFLDPSFFTCSPVRLVDSIYHHVLITSIATATD